MTGTVNFFIGYYEHVASPIVSGCPGFHFGSIRGFSKQFGYGLVNDGVLKVGAKLSQRHEYKAAAMKLRMRQGKTLVIDQSFTVEK